MLGSDNPMDKYLLTIFVLVMVAACHAAETVVTDFGGTSLYEYSFVSKERTLFEHCCRLGSLFYTQVWQFNYVRKPIKR